MTTADDKGNKDKVEVSADDVEVFLQSIFGKTSKDRLEDIKRMSVEERQALERSFEEDYLPVFDPENYPAEVIKWFEGHAMVPAHFVLERRKHLRGSR